MATTPSEYRGYKVEKIEATQLGYPLPNSRSLRQRIGHGTARKQSGVLVTEPDGYQRFFDTWAKAKKWIDDREGPENQKSLDERIARLWES